MKRGQIVERGEEKWLVRVFLGRDGEGKRNYLSKIVHGTKRQARNELTKLLRQADTKTLTHPTNLTLSEFLTAWYESKLNVAPCTLHSYKYTLAQYVEPTMGNVKLHLLTPLLVQSLVTKLLGDGLGPRTIEYAHSILHQALEKAVTLGLLVKNPAKEVELPSKTPRGFTILSPEQMLKLIDSESGRRFSALWHLLLDTGLRPGEALALKWSDLAVDTLRIQRVLRRKPAGSYEVVEQKAKTAKSLRPVTLSRSALEALRLHKQQQLKDRLAGGQRYVNNDFIFASRFGSFVDPNNVRSRFKSALKRAGLPLNIRLYDTRHSHATALLNQGKVNLAWVAARLGHASVQTTQTFYASVLPEAHREMAEITEQIHTQAREKAASA